MSYCASNLITVVTLTPDIKDDSDKVLRQAFKPVAMTLNSEALARKRNPFAKKTPEKKSKIEFSPIEVNTDQIKNSQELEDPQDSFEKEAFETVKEPEPKMKSPEPKVKSPEPEVKSQYFQPSKKPRVSGLLKPSSSSKKKNNLSGNSRQPSLFDMWSKKA